MAICITVLLDKNGNLSVSKLFVNQLSQLIVLNVPVIKMGKEKIDFYKFDFSMMNTKYRKVNKS